MHQIQSGQVIVDLCSVVKELVENSLDAGATNIGEYSSSSSSLEICIGIRANAICHTDVRFKNQGLESIEVQDNGDGISPHNYETVALKHYTSKLSTYSDLATLQTFGFRGEALSSLCALSRFSIITCMARDAPKGTKLEFEVSGKLKGKSTVAAQKGTTVIVENLFNNLPVRRRELERNIKREWSRVIGVLGQYACIQTGIKFSVSQQAAKGKKTILFSTKGNQTTRDNIANVFGAKTLTALVPLDLTLELEPTSGPSQRRSTQEDGGKKDVRIVGHISRPVSGEGRQTPDRQMFFVNARPCGLPQVSKAFNEVYKAYNASQSPFIFANIELDTHLYDVNVSPDKRTILLHDQTRMLENLKTALIALFESQEYTVPVSQLPAQKLPSYKQLTISRENTVSSQMPRMPVEPTEREDSSEDSSREEGEERVSDKTSNSKTRGAVSRDSMNRDREAVSLISNWMSRKTENRPEFQSSKANNQGSVGLSAEDDSEKLGEESGQVLAEDAAEDGSPTISQKSHAHSPRSSFSVADTDQQIAEQQTGDAHSQESSPRVSEPPIPALPSPVKPSSQVSNSFSSSARSQRAPAELATITIGDHTVTSSIGIQYPKRPRVDSISSTSRKRGRAETPKRPHPSFGSRLSQRFAAPGTTQQSISSEEEENEEDESEAEEIEDETRDSSLSPGSVDLPVQSEPAADDETIAEPLSSQAAIKEEPRSSQPGFEAPDDDDEYVDEDEKKAREEAKVQEMIKTAEEASAQPSEENVMRAKALLKGGGRKKDMTLNLVKILETSTSKIAQQLRTLDEALSTYRQSPAAEAGNATLDSEEAEEKLSLTISKSDFAKMKIIGQFNLGFILASRSSEASRGGGDEIFIIDQHASDEKYNFERLQSTTIVQSQRLVQPKTLELTALEEEIVMENKPALESNGFIVSVDSSGSMPVGQRCQLVSLPLSRETTFSLPDLEELLALLAEQPSGSIAVPRPSKVRKMFAMRACRSSIMIGKTLTMQQMGKVVRHLGELDKPWNCPHGRPTMRHLCGLEAWDHMGWIEEGASSLDGERGGGRTTTTTTTDWAAYIRKHRVESGSLSSSP